MYLFSFAVSLSQQASERMVAYSAGLFVFTGFLPNMYILMVWIDLILGPIVVVCVTCP